MLAHKSYYHCDLYRLAWDAPVFEQSKYQGSDHGIALRGDWGTKLGQVVQAPDKTRMVPVAIDPLVHAKGALQVRYGLGRIALRQH